MGLVEIQIRAESYHDNHSSTANTTIQMARAVVAKKKRGIKGPNPWLFV